jgi:hypothetical protein
MSTDHNLISLARAWDVVKAKDAEIARLRALVDECVRACRMASGTGVHIGRGEYSISQEAMQAIDAAIAKASAPTPPHGEEG